MDRSRRDRIRHGADAILADKTGKTLERDGPIHRIGRPRREQPRCEQITLARRHELRAFEDVDVLIDDLADPDHDVVARRRESLGALNERVRLFDDTLRDGGCARGLEGDVGGQQIGKIPADGDGQDQNRDDGCHDERQEQLPVEAGADLAQQRAPEPRARTCQPREHRGPDEHEHVERTRERRELGEMDEVIEQGQCAISDRVDEDAIVREVHAVAAVIRPNGGPERPAGWIVDAGKQLVADRPRRVRRVIDRAEAPAIYRNFDFAAGRPLAGHGSLDGAEHLEVRILRGDKWQRAIVEDQHVDDNRADRVRRLTRRRARANLPSRVKHTSLLGAKRCRLSEHIPLARGRGFHLRRLRRSRVFREVEREATDEFALRVVQLDRGGEARARERGLAPDVIRALRPLRRQRGTWIACDKRRQHGQRVDLVARFAQPFLQRLRMPLRLHGVLRRNE